MNRKALLNINYGLLSPVLILVIFGLTTLYSLDLVLFKNQVISLIIGIIFYIFFSWIDYRAIKFFSFPIYIIAIISLVILLIIGAETRGSVRWIGFFGYGIQFSELLKPFLGISLACFLSSKDNYSFRTLFSIVCFLIPIAFLVFLQPDLGSALVYVFTTIFVLISFGFPFRFFLFGLVGLLIMSPVFWNILHDYQKQRILTFLNPNDPLGVSYNAIQSVIAVGSGMLLGRGLGLGTQSSLRFLPERHTDFIFATLSEELGLIGGLILILAFIFLLVKIFMIFKEQGDLFCKIFTMIVFFIIFIQFFINIGMNIGILPIVGITLPFVSYGGSSLLSSFILLGILNSMDRGSVSRKVLEIK